MCLTELELELVELTVPYFLFEKRNFRNRIYMLVCYLMDLDLDRDRDRDLGLDLDLDLDPLILLIQFRIYVSD